MSTKIYRGFKIDTSSIQEVLGLVEAFRPFVTAGGKEIATRFIQKFARKPEDMSQAYIKWMDAQNNIRRTGIRNPDCDTDFELTFFPVEEGHFLGIAYTEHYEWFEEWLKQPKVSEYRYWNNTDGPEEVTAEEWERRGDDWKSVLKLHVPSMCGFSIWVSNPNGAEPDMSDCRKEFAS